MRRNNDCALHEMPVLFQADFTYLIINAAAGGSFGKEAG
jgi:hypothetical protein